MRREYKVLMVAFFNSLEMRVQRSEFKGKGEALFPAENRGQVDRAVDRSCTKHAQGVAIDHPVDRIEEGSVNRTIG